jgi:xanthine dehydrogenase small subunit
MSTIEFTLNGQPIVAQGLPPETTLLRYLRDQRQLTGTKEGCAEGDCGACSVALLGEDSTGRPAWRAVNSCLVLLPALHNRQVLSVEGLASTEKLHPAQQALVDHMGSQCGFCTPGFVMALFEGCYRDDLDAQERRDDQICGNLCRCTGYRPIRDALSEVAGSQPDDRFKATLNQPVAPLEDLHYSGEQRRFIRPTTLESLWKALRAEPTHRLVCGSTDLGLEVTKRDARFACLISLEALPSLRTFHATPDLVRIGASVPLSEVEERCADTLPQVSRMLRYFASRQIKNRATVGGNLCTASPIGDLAPVLLSLDAIAVLRSERGARRVPLSEFFLSYRQTALQPGEILAAVEVPRLRDDERAGAYKVSKRRELDISAVCAGMRVRLDDDGCVTAAWIAYGGMAATPKRATLTEQALLGRRWGEDAARDAAEKLSEDYAPITDHRGSDWYRATVAANLLIGFSLESQGHTLPARSTGTVQPGGQP